MKTLYFGIEEWEPIYAKLEEALDQDKPVKTLVVALLLLVGLMVVVVMASGGLVYRVHNGPSHSMSPSPSPMPTSVYIPHPTPMYIPHAQAANELQLCPTKPSGSQLDARGQVIYPIPNLIVADMLANGTWYEGCPSPLKTLFSSNCPTGTATKRLLSEDR